MPPPPRAPSTNMVIVLVAGMLITGCSNSLWSKWQDMQCVANCDAPDPRQRELFEQPVWQSATMFLGEIFCLFAFWIGESRLFKPKQRRTAAGTTSGERLPANARLATAPLSRPDESAFAFGESDISLLGDAHGKDDGLDELRGKELAAGMSLKKALLFTAPACADILGTTAMNVGLLYTPVSIYQMLRGGLVLWVGIFSVIFLGRKLAKAQWLALATVMAGIAVVGASSLIGPKPAEESLLTTVSGASAPSPLFGVALIFIAQLFTASQFVIEEKVMESHAVEPLLAAGFEGTSGLGVTMLLLIVAHLTYGRTAAGQGTYFDMATGWHEIVDNPPVWGSSIIIACSIAVYNATGLAVTKSVSATARSTIDSCRSLGIWAVSLYLGWETFKWLQVVGFALLVYGTFVFNGITTFPEWLVAKEAVPAIVLSEEDEEESVGEEEEDGVGREVDSMGRPITKRRGSGRAGEVAPLLRNVE